MGRLLVVIAAKPASGQSPPRLGRFFEAEAATTFRHLESLYASRRSHALLWSLAATAGIVLHGPTASAGTVVIDTFDSGSMTANVRAGQTTNTTGFLDAAAALGGKRSLTMTTEVAAVMPAGQSAQLQVDPSPAYASILHSQTADRSQYTMDWAGTMAPSPYYDLASVLGSTQYMQYGIEVDFSILQLVGAALPLEMDVYTVGGGTAIYAAAFGPSAGSGTATLTSFNSVGTPDPTHLISFKLRKVLPAGTGTAGSLTFNEVRAVPEPTTATLVIFAGGAARLLVRSHTRGSRRRHPSGDDRFTRSCWTLFAPSADPTPSP